MKSFLKVLYFRKENECSRLFIVSMPKKPTRLRDNFLWSSAVGSTLKPLVVFSSTVMMTSPYHSFLDNFYQELGFFKSRGHNYLSESDICLGHGIQYHGVKGLDGEFVILWS